MDEPALVFVESPPSAAAGSRNLDPVRQQQMVLQYAPMIRYIAGRLSLRLPSHVSQEDLISSGILGLIDAIQKYDLSKHVNFKTYAEFRIKGAMLDELRSLDWVPRSVRKKSQTLERAYSHLQKSLGRPAEAEEVAAFLGVPLAEFHQLLEETKTVSLVPLDVSPKKLGGRPGNERDLPEVIEDDRWRDALQKVHLSQLREVVFKAIEALPNKEKLLISLYYYEELTMKEIGQVMGYTESRISQLHTQAMYRLRERLREYAWELKN